MTAPLQRRTPGAQTLQPPWRVAPREVNLSKRANLSTRCSNRYSNRYSAYNGMNSYGPMRGGYAYDYAY